MSDRQNLDPLGVNPAQVARQYWWLPVLRGIVSILFGLLAVIWPKITAGALLWIVGLFALIDGILILVDALRHRGQGGTALGVVLGVLAVAFGLAALFWTEKTAVVIVVILGIWAIIAGLVELVASIDLRSAIGSGWVWGTILGAVTLVFGILVVVWPKASIVSVVWLIGLWAIIAGLVLVVVGFQVRRLGRAERTV
ncbi:HdeD family acid-resistance protein [Luteimicrobium subarcticum]|uniref:Uncharacterized membrane protein HdeD (DUF308 family) n=1 Tax=Luteimicrobium subarcticum TaxID=620910 RepID=A0A2M8WRZ8_9MICO|nr:HdeD family acid-resistance protein [Luteimicrobium subarcticum]PJI93654.1 uncharacterized membrane protein HdeD (DUF308 family) [Luteimicrobium subarcticum]